MFPFGIASKGIELSFNFLAVSPMYHVLFRNDRRKFVRATCVKPTLTKLENITQGTTIDMELCKIKWLKKTTHLLHLESFLCTKTFEYYS